MDQVSQVNEKDIIGEEHWTKKDGSINLFMWNKCIGSPADVRGTILFVHGSSMASQPTFDLYVESRPYSSAMNFFAAQGYDTWCVDMEGYGHSDKDRETHFFIQDGANDVKAAAEYISKLRDVQKMSLYGISSGALRASLFAQDNAGMVDKLIMDAMVWTGEGSPTLEDRKKKLPEFLANKRRPINLDFVRSIFSRDHAGCADNSVVEAFAKAICIMDDSIPNGTYIDMCQNLPVVDPEKITVPSFVMRGEFDGIAGMDDLLAFFNKLPNQNKQFTVMAGISHASFQLKNYMFAYHVILGFLSQPELVYKN